MDLSSIMADDSKRGKKLRLTDAVIEAIGNSLMEQGEAQPLLEL